MTYADAQTVKELSGISAGDLDNVANTTELDALITKLNERAKSRIDEYCQRDFGEHLAETVAIDGNGRTELSVPQRAAADGLFYPITTLTEVKLSNSVLDADDYRLKPQSNALADRNAGIIERKHAVWPRGWENIEVTFDWGFASPPGEIKAVAESMITDTLLSAVQDGKSSGAESVSMDGYSVSFGSRMRLSEEHKDRLSRFRRIIV